MTEIALQSTKNRQTNIELLRILAMFMIISLHYIGKGVTLFPYQLEGFAVNGYISWLIEAFSYVAVNVYILISGYFLVNSKFRLDKMIRIWLQVFFYSAGIYLIFKAVGILPENYDTPYFKAMFFTPIGMQHNWFASYYLILYLLFPFLAVLIKKVTKRQLQACILILLVIFSKVSNLFFPMSKGFADDGCGIIWMICLFVVAGYIKLYVPINGKWLKNLSLYIGFAFLTYASFFMISIFYMKVGKLSEFREFFYANNSPTIIVASIALFLAFLNMGLKEGNAFINKTIIYIAGLTFGIYLIHEHILLRDLWVTLWKVPEAFNGKYFILHFVCVILAVFISCGIIEGMRQFVFGFLYRSRLYKALIKKTEKIDSWMNEEKKGNNV